MSQKYTKQSDYIPYTMKRCFSSFCNVIISRDTQLKSLTIEIVVSRLHCIVCWFACLFEEKADRFFTPCPYIYILSVFFCFICRNVALLSRKQRKSIIWCRQSVLLFCEQQRHHQHQQQHHLPSCILMIAGL